MSSKQTITLTPKELEYMLKILSNEENIDRLTIVAEDGVIGIRTDIYFNGKKYDITDYDHW